MDIELMTDKEIKIKIDELYNKREELVKRINQLLNELTKSKNELDELERDYYLYSEVLKSRIVQ